MSDQARRYDVCVVGGGVNGLATARSLAQMGKSVVLCEQHQIGHELGSSTGPARAFAVPHNQTHLIEMALAAAPLWRELEAESGQTVFTETGAMLCSRTPDTVAAALRQAGADYEALTPREVQRRFGLSVPRMCLWSSVGGTLWAEQALGALRASAEAHGVEIREHAPVAKVDDTGDQVVVTTDGGATVDATTAVVAAGPWSSPLLRQAGVDVAAQPSRQTVVYVPMADASSIPALYQEGDPSVYWVTSGANELRVGAHVDGDAAADPDVKGEPDQRIVDLIEKHLIESFPDRTINISRADTCFYTKTENEEFVIRRTGRIVVGIACNGRGFKFAPLTGKKLAELANQ